MSLADRILELLGRQPGLTDRELTNLLFDPAKHPSQINQECRRLEQAGLLTRRSTGVATQNYPSGADLPDLVPQIPVPGFISEDDVKRAVGAWLERDGWTATVMWGRDRGVDILARRGQHTWIIEAKGSGSLQAMRVNYFIAMLGETLQRMDDPLATYSIALPDLAQFRGLWSRLPALAKTRTTISAMFVSENGKVEHLTA